MPDIRDITEEQIFRTLGRGVPICDLLNGADSNAIKSNAIVQQAIDQIPEKNKEHVRGLELILDRQKLNLESIRDIKKSIGCK